MWEFDTEFSDIIQRTPSVKSFRLLLRTNNITFRPGQYFYINIIINGIKAEHHFSFSSSPTEKGYIEFTKRITEHEFSQALAVMKPGGWAHLQGPEGEFVLPDNVKKLAFLSGGIGITPLRSMLKFISDTESNWDIVLLYGNKNVEEIVFRHELDEISEKVKGIRVFHVIADPPEGWKGKTGIITKQLVQELIPDCSERLFYTSGPPSMVASLEKQLTALNIPESQLKHDNFTGYD